MHPTGSPSLFVPSPVTGGGRAGSTQEVSQPTVISLDTPPRFASGNVRSRDTRAPWARGRVRPEGVQSLHPRPPEQYIGTPGRCTQQGVSGPAPRLLRKNQDTKGGSPQ